MTTFTQPLPSTSSLIYGDDSIMPDDDGMDSYQLPAPQPAPAADPLLKATTHRRSRSFDSLSQPLPLSSVTEEDGSSLDITADFLRPPPASRPSRPSMSTASKPPPAPSRPSLSASAASRTRPSHKRSASSSTSAPTLLPIQLTPSELESNISSLAATLHDTTSHEWDTRIAALSQLQSIALGCQLTRTLPLFVQHFRQLRQPLCQQIGDLRSSVVRSTCTALSTIAQLCGQQFSDECDAVIPALLKLVAVSVAVIAQSGDEAVRAMLRFCSPTRGLSAIIDSARASTSAITRARCMEYVATWLEERRRRAQEDDRPVSAGDESRWEAAIDGLVRDKLADKTESVRVGARRAAVLYCRLWGESGRRLLDGLDEKVRRMIEEERKKDGGEESWLPTAAGADKPKETERSVARTVSTKRRSMSIKAVEEPKIPVVQDKENSNPNTAAEQPPPAQPSIIHKAAVRRQSTQPPQQPAATTHAASASTADDRSPPVPALRNGRRQSFSLVSLVAADSGAAKRLSGARRVSVAALPAQHDSTLVSVAALPPGPPRPSLSINTRSVAGPPAAAMVASAALPVCVIPPLAAAELTTPPQSPYTVSTVDMTVAVQAAIEQAVFLADADVSVAAPTRRSRSPPPPTRIEQQADERETPAEKPRAIATRPDLPKRKTLGAPITQPTATASLIPRRASFSLSNEHKAPAARHASVTTMLASIRDGSWSARVAALESLTSFLASLGIATRAVVADVESHMDRLVAALADKAQDSHPRVVTAALSALAALLASCQSLPSLPPLLSSHLVVLLPSLFRVLSRSQQSVKQQCDALLTALCGVYPGVDLLPPLISLLSASSTLSSAERSHASEFAMYVCEWGDDELRQIKRNMMDAVKQAEEEKRPINPSRPQEHISAEQQLSREKDYALEKRRAELEAEIELEAELVDGQDESKYDTDSDEDAALLEQSAVLLLPSARTVSPPRSVALSPGLARRLAPVLSAQSPVAASASHSPVDLVPVPEPICVDSSPVVSAFLPPSPPTRAQPVVPMPALSFPTHSIFAGPREAIMHPVSVEKASIRSSATVTTHQRSLSASSAPSVSTLRHKHDAATKQKARKRISLTAAPSAAPSASTSTSTSSSSLSAPTAPPARRSPARPLPVALSDTDVSALIYQWKHADLPVVLHSLHFATQQLSNPRNTTPQLCNSAIDRIIAAALTLPTTHPTTTPAVLALLATIVSPALCGDGGKAATRLAVHVQAAAFPHAAGLVELVAAAHGRAVGAQQAGSAGEREAVEQLWTAVQHYCHRPTLVTAITTQLSTAPPTHHPTLTLLLSSLASLLPHLPSQAVQGAMVQLSHALCLLLSHEQVVVRKQCVGVWVACWRVLGGGVERWMSGLTAVSRRLVDIYLNKAKEEQAADKKSSGDSSRA